MAGRASVVLREQFEAAERYARANGSLASIVEVRANVDVAIRVARDKLRLIRSSMTSAERAAEGADGGPRAEERLLEDELAELVRLREHMKVLLGTVGR